MPLQYSITQPTGVVATYHVIETVAGNFTAPGQNNASVNINSYLSSDAFKNGDQPLNSITNDISQLINNAVVAAPSILAVIEAYLLTTAAWQGATQVS